MDLATAIRETVELPVEEQLELIAQVWDRIADTGWSPDVDPDLRAKLDERAKELDENPARAVSWEDIVRSVADRP